MGRWLFCLAVWIVAGCAPSPRAFVDPEPLRGPWTVALLPLADYTANRDAPDRLAPMIQAELIQHENLLAVETGRVEAALAQNPWMLTDRIPPDIVDSLGTSLGADGLLVGSVLAYGYRSEDGEAVPEVSLSLRLLQVPGGHVLWSAVHHRDGNDRETLFGLGRVTGLERLAEETVREIMSTFPGVRPGTNNNVTGAKGEKP
jgi:hypothetical protein